jgi:hypothetical protein
LSRWRIDTSGIPRDVIAHEFTENLRGGSIIGSTYLQELFVQRAFHPNPKAGVFP